VTIFVSLSWLAGYNQASRMIFSSARSAVMDSNWAQPSS